MSKKALYVTNPKARLQRLDGQVAVVVAGRPLERLPAAEVDRVLLFGNVQVTTQVLALLLAEGVPVSYFSGRGRYRGQLVAPDSGSVFVRLAQHRRHGEPEFRLSFARLLVRDKLRAGQRLLDRYGHNHPAEVDQLREVSARLVEGQLQAQAAVDEDVLRGIEGAAAAVYFRGFGQMVRAPFVFERRSQHPAHNPVNALLNLGYTLLANEIAGRLEAAGLDPRVGYYHGVRYGRISLALDLLEVHRAEVIDRLTLALLNRRMFAPEDFVELGEAQGVRLQPDALRRYLKAYEGALGEVSATAGARERIREQVVALRRMVLSGEVTPEVGDVAGGL